MKILKIRFKNLNSLYGEWEIDFTSPQYTANGIFSITGPTGAGKSTILDAICLALYARTPRLKTINKSSNQIISRQTGECYAEVVFETNTGKYRCHWAQKTARSKAGANLQNAQHEISEAESGKILASQIREVAELVEQKTGLDFERFTRSILLAQGGFAVFLQADPDSRAPILEQITGTEIYSTISQKVHERYKTENDKLELLLAATSGITLLSPDDEALLQSESADDQEIEKSLAQTAKTLSESIIWLNNIAKLNEELKSLNIEAESIDKRIMESQPTREKLALANKAAELDSDYATLISQRQQQKMDTENQETFQQQLPQLQESLQIKAAELQKAEENLQNTKQNQLKELTLIKKIRELDIILAEKNKNLNNAQDNAKKLANKLKANEKFQNKNEKDQEKLDQEMKSISKYLTDHARDEALVTKFTGIQEQFKTLKKASADLSEKQKNNKLQKKLVEDNYIAKQTAEKTQIQLKQQHENAQEEVRKIKLQLDKLLDNKLMREYRTEHETLLRELAFLNKIASLKKERKNLQDDQPCPLCGSLHHPFALGNVPEANETEQRIKFLADLIQKAESLENNLKHLQKAENQAETNLHEAALLCERTKQKYETSNSNLANLQKNIAQDITEKQKLNASLLLKLNEYGISSLPETELETILNKLQKTLEKWQSKQKDKTDLNDRQANISTEKLTLMSILTELDKQKTEIETTLNTCQTDFDQQSSERYKLYDNKIPDDEESRWQQLVTAAENKTQSAKIIKQKADDDLKQISTTITNLKQAIEAREQILLKLETAFLSACLNAGFADELSFSNCRLAPAARNELNSQAATLDQIQTKVTARTSDCKQKLHEELSKKLTTIPLEELQQQKTELESKIKEISQKIGATKQKLADNQQTKQKLKDKQQEIDAQKLEFSRWLALHDLIGSADGKKFRNFAQGLTFELMIAYANQQLSRMSDRYLLVHDKTKPLELNVIDNYQAGEERTTKNLSGGESFLVSLALALGLSQMASRKVQVDSLFLDEGFGTLDEDALETALESLANLQQTGKLIGIISHVPALKERISTQIIVRPLAGGKSQITGPGITQL